MNLENRPVLHYLVRNDMQRLFNLAADLGYIELSEGYVSKCHLCLDVRKYLVSIGDYAELQPREFYEQLK